MTEVTIEMLRNKIAANEERIRQAKHIIEVKSKDIALWNRENCSFEHCLRILEESH